MTIRVTGGCKLVRVVKIFGAIRIISAGNIITAFEVIEL